MVFYGCNHRLLMLCAVIFPGATHGFLSVCPVARHTIRSQKTLSFAAGKNSLFYNDFEGYNDNKEDSSDEEDDEGDEEFQLTSAISTMDWRTFRRNLARSETSNNNNGNSESKMNSRQPSICQENQELLKGQNLELYQEFASSIWAHLTATPEIGGLVVRMPLEVELQRNYKHSVTGKRLMKEYSESKDDNNDQDHSALALWYKRAQSLIEADLKYLTEEVAVEGQIDATTLDDKMAEMLQLYLDHQETWQEVCLVLEHHREHQPQDNGTTTLVLNRPMAMKLTENIAQLVLYGAFTTGSNANRSSSRLDLNRFMKAFGAECAVYIGGPDHQDQPAELIHGIAGLVGSVEIAPGTGIYRGGLMAAVEGVLSGLYRPLDFRFFVGCRLFEDSTLDLSVMLGKYQPIACARSVPLKQCISLPKPLWHEVLELCGGEMHEISQLESEKRDDLRIQIIDDDEEDDDDDDDDDDDEDDILDRDELGELSRFDDEDDDDDDFNDYYRRR